MKITEERAYQLSLYGAIPLLSGIVSGAVVKWGHSFAIFAKTGLLYGGLFGAVQTLGASVLNDILNDYFPRGLLGISASLVVSHLACGIYSLCDLADRIQSRNSRRVPHNHSSRYPGFRKLCFSFGFDVGNTSSHP